MQNVAKIKKVTGSQDDSVFSCASFRNKSKGKNKSNNEGNDKNNYKSKSRSLALLRDDNIYLGASFS